MNDRLPSGGDGPSPNGSDTTATGAGARGFDRVPPHSLDAEVSVLGAALLSANAASDVVQMLIGEHFYRNAHRIVFEAIRALQSEGEPVDTVTVTDWLSRRDRLDEVGGPAAIHDLTVAVPTAANATHYARLVRQKALLRRLIEAGTEVARLGYESSDDADEVVDRAESIIYDVAQTGAQSEYAKLGDLLTASFEQIEQLAERGSEVTGLATGFNDLDRLTAGLQPQNLVIIAARPAMGKCLAGSTELVEVSGRRWTIRDLVAQKPDEVVLFGLDLQGARRLVPVTPSDFVANGRRATWKLTTASGRTITATDNHPFLTPGGWRELAQLSPTDKVAAVARLPAAGDDQVGGTDLRMLAHVLAAGDVHQAASPQAVTDHRYAPASPELTPGAVLTRPRPRGGPGVTHRRRATATWNEWLASFGLETASPAELRVPGQVYTATADQIALFVTRFLSLAERIDAVSCPSAHGKPCDDGRTEAHLIVASPSAALLRDVRHLLLRLDVAAQVAEFDGTAHLTVAGCRALERLGNASGAELDVVQLLAHDAGFTALNLDDAVAGGERDGDVLWDPVVAVEPAGYDDVYDLTIPRLHNFVAGDLIVHNSSLALGISHYVTTRLHRPSILFSLEMSKIEIVNRLLSTEARIDSSRLRTGRLEDSDWRKLGDALGSLADAPLYIDDTPSISLNEIRAKCRRLQQKHGLDLVIVDYLQLMQSHRRIESRQQEVAEISRGLKMLAKQLDVPVIALSQLSRQPESRTDKRPQLADLRESGSIEQDADIVGFIYRDEVYDDDSPDRGIAELIIAKHRNGATGVVRLAFLNHLTTFANLARGPSPSGPGAGPAGAPIGPGGSPGGSEPPPVSPI
ncbi:MAG: replicative DNA helicase [Nitriliruptoraceae bacterium]